MHTCCSANNQKFTFENNLGRMKSCRWLTTDTGNGPRTRNEKYCNKRYLGLLVKDQCPEACHSDMDPQCFEYVDASLTVSPSTMPSSKPSEPNHRQRSIVSMSIKGDCPHKDTTKEVITDKAATGIKGATAAVQSVSDDCAALVPISKYMVMVSQATNSEREILSDDQVLDVVMGNRAVMENEILSRSNVTVEINNEEIVAFPSASPSETPTKSAAPSKKPTSKPTKRPTRSPIMSPTSGPSDEPSILPSASDHPSQSPSSFLDMVAVSVLGTSDENDANLSIAETNALNWFYTESNHPDDMMTSFERLQVCHGAEKGFLVFILILCSIQ